MYKLAASPYDVVWNMQSKFIKNINSKYVMVNTSPTLEQSLDIKQEDLLKEKSILLPNIYKENLLK